MKFTLNLLKEVINLHSPIVVANIANTLTEAGIEVEEIIDYANIYKDFSIAYIKSAEPHPNADKLQVCQVITRNNGHEEELTVVCGASNARAGIYVVFAPVGTHMAQLNFTLTKATIRGVESFGMLVSEKEIGLSEEHGKIMEFISGTVGETLAAKLQLDDVVFDVSITPNRGDCLGIIGIARELQAYGLGIIKDNLFNEKQFNDKNAPAKDLDIKINLKDSLSNAFALYKVVNVNNQNINHPELEKIKNYLSKCGFRSISPVVDIVNYCALLFNQPMHAYNVAVLGNYNQVVIENIAADVNVTDLKDKQYIFTKLASHLTTKTTEVVDDKTIENTQVRNLLNKIPIVNFYNSEHPAHPVHGAFAGIMGFAASSCTPETSEILLEIAHFSAINIALAKRELAINTDAGYRFERGVDLGAMDNVATYTLNLLQKICSAKLESFKIVNNFIKQDDVNVTLQEINNLTGMQFTEQQVIEVLNKLSYKSLAKQGFLQISPPSWRNDVLDSGVVVADLIRVYGYHNLKESVLQVNTTDLGKTTSAQYDSILDSRVFLSSLGLLEVYSLSFISKVLHEQFNLLSTNVHVVNAISEDLKYMRSSIIPSLMLIAKNNIVKSSVNFKIYEVSSVYTENQQISMASGILVGNSSNKSWKAGESAFDVWDAKNIVNELLLNLGLNPANLTVNNNDLPNYYHPGRAAKYSLGAGKILAYFGQIHPKTLLQLDLKSNIIMFEVFIENVPKATQSKFIKKPIHISSFTPVIRDFSIVIDTKFSAQEIIKVVASIDKNLISAVAIFDIYKGNNMPYHQQSVSFSVTLSAKETTLVDTEIKQISEQIVTALGQKFGATLRA